MIGVVYFFTKAKLVEVGAGVRHQSRLCVDGVAECRDIGKSAKNLWVLAYQVVIDVPQKLIGVPSAAKGDERMHGGVRERIMQILDAFGDVCGLQRVHVADVFPFSDDHAASREKRLGLVQKCVRHPRDRRQRARRRDDPDAGAGL